MSEEAETIFGLDLAPEAFDEILQLHGKMKNQDELGTIERALMRTKWFEYRFLHPTQATYLFADHYKTAYRRAYARNLDSRAGPFIPVFLKTKEKGAKHAKSVIDAMEANPSTVRAIWRCRRIADAMGIPYDIYATLAMTRRLSYWQRAHLPRPCHLYDAFITDHVAEKWEEHQKAKLYFSDLEQYKTENFHDLPAQNDHHEWLFGQLQHRLNSPHTLARLIFEERVMPEQKARSRLGSEVCDAAALVAESIPS